MTDKNQIDPDVMRAFWVIFLSKQVAFLSKCPYMFAGAHYGRVKVRILGVRSLEGSGPRAVPVAM